MNRTKTCRRCSTKLPLDDFYVTNRTRDGYSTDCKECSRRAVRESYRRRAALFGSRLNDPARRAYLKVYKKLQHAKNPEKERARWAVKYALGRKHIVRLPCEVCGAQKSQAHHSDYSKPLQVRWLCFVHHRAEHGQFKDSIAEIA